MSNGGLKGWSRSAEEYITVQKRKAPMKRKGILTGLFVVFLSSAVGLEARTAGHSGVRGFGHSQARVFGHLGHQNFKSFGVGACSHGCFGFGFRTHRFCNAGFGLGYYWPFYGYSTYSTSYPETSVPPPISYGNSQAYYGKISRPDTKPNCKDTWTDQRNSSSMSSFINSVFELQCENEHPTSEPNRSQGDGQD